MKTAHRRQARTKAELLARNPVFQAVHTHKVDDTYQNKAMACRIEMFLLEDGEDATSLMATLAVVIGATCQLATSLDMYDHPPVRRLHGALRSLQAMALAGYKWQAHLAPVLCNALDDADALSKTLRGTQAQILAAATDAEWFANQISAHQVTAQSVAVKVTEVPA